VHEDSSTSWKIPVYGHQVGKREQKGIRVSNIFFKDILQ
jgi:hypothetical protein